MAESVPNWGEIWISKFMKFTGHQTKLARDPFQDTAPIKLSNIKNKERNLKAAKEKELET